MARVLPRRLAPVLPTTYSPKYLPLAKAYAKSHMHVGFPPHAFAHWGGFAPAALRGARTSTSVSFSGLPLSRPLRISGLVSHYLTNNLIRRHLILGCCLWRKEHSSDNPLSGISFSFPKISQAQGQINDVLLSITPALLPDLHG